jgi:hypothetical protein
MPNVTKPRVGKKLKKKEETKKLYYYIMVGRLKRTYYDV